MRALLGQFRKGIELLNYFDRTGRMESKHRSHLAECIIDYYLQHNNGKLVRENFEEITLQIVELFPCEIQVSTNLFI